MKTLSLGIIFAGFFIGAGALGASLGEEKPPTINATDDGRTVQPSGMDSLTARRMRTLEGWPWDVSPDGRVVTVIDWTTGDLAVIDLVTGEQHRVTDDGDWSTGAGWSGSGVFSPDGSRIAYVWEQHDCGQGGSSRWTKEIRVVAWRERAEPVTVVPCREGILYYSPWDWTPDGSGLLVVFRQADGSRRMTTVDVNDGSIHEIAVFPDDQPFTRPRYSPDGRHVVYMARRDGSDDLDLYAIPTDGGVESAWIEGPGSDMLFGWDASGEHLYSYNVDGLKSGLYRQPFADGSPTGDLELVRRDLWRAVPLGQTPTGFAYVVTIEQAQVQIGSLDIERGRVLAPFGPVEDPSMGASKGGAWSPDGRYLAYLRTPSGSMARLVIRSTDGGEHREYPFPLRSGGDAITWAPDGETLIVSGSTPTQEGLFEIDLQSGGATPLLVEPDADFGSDWRAHSVSRDGREAILANTGPDRDEIRIYDVLSGEFRVVVRFPFVTETAVSPDGQTLAFTSTADGSVNTVPMAGGQAVQRFRDPDLWGQGLEWTSDGRYLVWVHRRAVWRLPATGGEPTRIAELPGGPGGYPNLRLQSGGSAVSYNGGKWRGEVWVLEDRGN